MKFKRLEVNGFKSFADHLQLNFDDGITGIVGPNGCGKSNVADAVRWVLGEQSAKTLRGSNMQDVIFGGTETRKPMTCAAVSLCFENDGKVLPGEIQDLEITRKLYRNGDSEYKINDVSARLKDIVDILRDLGMSKDGYSIIGQGKIDAILSARPDERRGIFEEACGISKFKARRTETQRKMDRTNDNINRLNDLLGEIERQLEPLRKQAETAKKYAELAQILKTNELNYFLFKCENVSVQKKEIEDKIAVILSKLREKENENTFINKEFEQINFDIANLDKEVDRLRNEQLELTVLLERKAGESNLNIERIKNLRSICEKLQVQILESEMNAEQNQDNLQKVAQESESKKALVEELRVASENLSAELNEISARLSIGASSQDENEQKLFNSLQKLADIKANASGLLAEKNVLISRKQEVEETLKREQTNADFLKKSAESFEYQLKAKQEEYDELQKEVEELNADYEAERTKLEDFRNQLIKGNNYMSSLESKSKLLQRIIDNNDNYNTSVKLLLNEAKIDYSVEKLICGTVAKLINVPSKLEVAIDVALGGAMQNIVTQKSDDAKKLIDLLKRKQFGRVTFLPIEAVKSRDIENSLKSNLSKQKGYIGIASELIKYESKYKGIFSNLLGRTVICDTLDNAVAMARATAYATKIISLEGDVISPSGSMTGGSIKTNSSNLLSSERELVEINEELSRIAYRIQSFEKQIAQIEGSYTLSKNTLEKYKERLQLIQTDKAVFEEKNEKIAVELQQKEEQVEQIEGEIGEIEDRIAEIEDDLRFVDATEEEISMQRKMIDESKGKSKEEYDGLRAKRDSLFVEHGDVKAKLAKVVSELESVRAEQERLTTEIEESKSFVSNARAELKANENELFNLSSQTNAIVDDEELKNSLNEIKDKLEHIDEQKKILSQKLTENNQKKNDVSTEMQKISDKRFKEEFNLSKIDSDLEVISNNVMESYQLDYEGAKEFRVDEFDSESAPALITKLKRQISALGFVNPDAIVEYEEQSKRFVELDEQRNDLRQAKKDMQKIVDDLTKEMTVKFRKGFEEISKNFEGVFKELFGGGASKLIMEQEEGVEELEQGIKIEAQPPGKKLQSISLLSGGERAFTAIAILFSILKMRPMPFVILDEIEAALDEANVVRFAHYLKRFSEETQFIVITHRKPTMELSDSLLGVTMQEKGVSNIVSVKLSEAIKVSEITAS